MALFDFIKDMFEPIPQPETQSLQEGVLDSGYDPDRSLTAAQGGSAYYRRLTGATTRQLPELTQERAIELSYWLYQTNPLARRILKLTRDFAVAEGLTVSVQGEGTEKEARQEIVDRFWNDHINHMDMTLYEHVLELGLSGELMLPVFVNPVSGFIRLGYIDPADIKEVVTDPQNVKHAVAVVVRGAMGQDERRYKIISLDEDPLSKSYGRLAGVDTDREGNVLTEYHELDEQGQPKGEARRWDGACFYFKINAVSNSARGWPDLLCLIDWLDVYDQMLFSEVDRQLLMKAFVWDVKLEGADANAVNKRSNEIGSAPKPGSVRVHNDKESWEAVTPSLNEADAQRGADLILSNIATGSSMPKTWLNGIMDVNRASATDMSEPTIKELSARQRFVRYMIEQTVTFVLDQAELHGQLPKRKSQKGNQLPESWQITVNTPEIRSRDMKDASEVLFKVSQSLAVAKAEGAIDTELEQEVLAAIIPLLGVDVDLAALRERMAKAKAEQDEEGAGVIARAVQEAERVLAAKADDSGRES